MNAERLIDLCNQIIDTKQQLDKDYNSMVNYENDFNKKSCVSILGHLNKLENVYKDVILKLMAEDGHKSGSPYFQYTDFEPGNHHVRILLKAAYEVIFTIGIDNEGGISIKVLDGRLGSDKGINEYSCDNFGCMFSIHSSEGEDKIDLGLDSINSSYDKLRKKWLNNFCNIANDYSLLENLTQTVIAKFAKEILEESRSKNQEVTNRLNQEEDE